MSRDRYRKNTANNHENCLIEEKLTQRDIALRLLQKCKQREATKSHEVIFIDSKTYTLRETGDKPIQSKKSQKHEKGIS
jgi:hypothetical protein